jgi:hypothetical protein
MPIPDCLAGERPFHLPDTDVGVVR